MADKKKKSVRQQNTKTPATVGTTATATTTTPATESASSSSASSIVSRAAQGVRHLMGIQMVTRALTFVLNVAILRTVDRSVAGANGVQLQLVLALVLSLSRDVARRVYSRVPSTDKDSLRHVANIAWTSVAISAVAAPVACLFALRTEPVPPPQPAGSYAKAVWIFGAAALIEALSEPASCAAQFEQRYTTRLRVESLGAIARCVLSFVLVKYVALNSRSPVHVSPLVCLALGQVSFALVLLVGYAADAAKHKTLFLPSFKKDSKEGLVGKDISKLVAVYEWQAVQKVVLTEGEKIVLVLATSASTAAKDSEATYSLVNNLCSLVVRFIFQPIEEVCFTAFGRLASSGNSAAAARVLVVVLRLMAILGACFVCFGPAYSHFAIDFLYTAKYSATEAPRVLAWYCVYILLVAINGTTEAFVHSVASEHELRLFNFLLIGFSAVFVVSASVFIRIPAIATVGLVWANCISKQTNKPQINDTQPHIYAFFF